MTHEERLRRADKAKQLLSEPYLQECFDDLRDGFVKSIESCKWNDSVKQNNLMLSLQLLRGIKNLMNSHITDGKVAQKEIDKMNKPKRGFSIAR